MGERTSYAPGQFCWVDLMTPDPPAAARFYGGLFGWEAEEQQVEGATYWMLRQGGHDLAGMTRQGDEERAQGIAPLWQSYVSVADVDEAARRAGELGAEVHGPFDVATAGRMAVMRDPTGAWSMLWQPRDHAGAGLVNAPGAFSWSELATTDPEAAKRFYGELFGWSFSPHGPVETIHVGEAKNGDVRRMGPGEAGVPPHWVVCFATESVEGTVTRAAAAGASVLAPAMDIPAGRFAVLRDPQGAAFAVFAGDMDP